MNENFMIEAVAISKCYGQTQALDGVDLEVAAGSILGVLGPNGAGKTTGVRILTTLTTPDSGQAWVAGHNVVTEAAAVRRKIGVTGQDATLDDALTGRQNLVMVGELSRLRRAEAKRRAAELLELFELEHAADRIVKGYSGGMRRRLDLAASLVMRPPVLFLDEPTTGLDPTSRQRMWTMIRSLVADGVTLWLTTQYLDEADALADRIAVIDRGRLIAQGSPRELKAAIGSQLLEVTLSAPHAGAAEAIESLASGSVQIGDGGRRLRAPVASEPGLATSALRALDEAGALVDDIAIHRPSLDDVFATLTGTAPSPDDDEEMEGVAA
jgi:ABC-2 type transport system ATP-binding protein